MPRRDWIKSFRLLLIASILFKKIFDLRRFTVMKMFVQSNMFEEKFLIQGGF